ncbi:MAG: hypothetical protein V4672_01730 [Verrucomicrobiota bacterium]
MEKNSIAQFKVVREASLETWTRRTGRNARKPSDIEGSWECKWQNRAIDDCGFNHVSFFCSSAAWACSITDILVLKNYDKIQFKNEKKIKVLFRHYVRLLLVVSEVLDDLVAVRMIEPNIPKQLAREKLSKVGGISIHQLSHFINSCCKHKFNGYHACNFDLPIAFEDDLACSPQNGDLCVTSIDFKSASRIVMPKLIEVISVVTHAYDALDIHCQDESFFRDICGKFDFKG